MTVAELLDRLSTLFPKGWATPEHMDAWEPLYTQALLPFEGHRLANGFTILMTTWTKSFPPKPADILEAVREAPASSGGKAKSLYGHNTDAKLMQRIAFWTRQYQLNGIGEYGLALLGAEA